MTDIITPEIVTKILANHDPSFEVVSYEVHPAGSEIAQFLSVIYSIKVILKKKGESKEFIKKIFFKSLPLNPLRLEIVREGEFFEREVKVYTQILQNITKTFGFSWYPKVFHAQNDYIALEDLKHLGFKMTDRLKGLDWDHSILLIKTLAEYHASTFLLYDGGNGKQMLADYPEFTDHMFKSLDDTGLSESVRSTLSNTCRDIEGVLREENLDNLIPKVRYFMEKFAYKDLITLSGIPKNFPCVVNHGDLWTSNIMFKYDSQEKPEEIKLLDFQKAKIGSRIIDLSYVAFTSLCKSIWNGKMKDLLRVYFDRFNQVCTSFGAELPLKFNGHELTWEYFLEEWNIYLPYGIMYALLYTFLMYNEQVMPDAENISESDMNQVEGKPNLFSNLWKSKITRERLIILITKFVPEEVSEEI